MNKVSIIYLLLILFIGCFPKKDKSKIDHLDVHFIYAGLHIMLGIDCNIIDDYNDKIILTNNKYRFYSKIEDQDVLLEFENLFNSLENELIEIDSYSYDIRIKIIINWKDGTKDELCLGESFGGYLNGAGINNSSKVLKLIKTETS